MSAEDQPKEARRDPHPNSSPPPASLDPLSSISALAASLDDQPDIPSFLNSLLPAPPISSAPARINSKNDLPTSDIPDLSSTDKTLSDLLALLSMLYHDTLAAQEQAIHDISRTVPRLTYDLQFMLESATSLHSSLGLVQDRVARQVVGANSGVGGAGAGNIQINNASNDSSQSPLTSAPAKPSTSSSSFENNEETRTRNALEKLAQLDLLKTRMESARDILREAESWSTLESEISSLISSFSWSKAADRLAEANRSLIVFQNTPAEYDSRRLLLVSLQNQLEAALSAALKDALARVDTDACSRFYAIFETMDRAQEFKTYYFDATKSPIIDEWTGSSARLVEVNSGNGGGVGGNDLVKFSSFLPKFYATILSTLNTERIQIPLVFTLPLSQPSLSPSTFITTTAAAGVMTVPTTSSLAQTSATTSPTSSSSATILLNFLQTTLDALSPSMHDRLEAVAEYHGSEALPELIRTYKATGELFTAVKGILDKMLPPTPPSAIRGSGTATTPTSSTPPLSTPVDEKIYEVGTGGGASGLAAENPPVLGRTNSSKSNRNFSGASASIDTNIVNGTAINLASLSHDLETSLFEPFLDLQSNYATLENKYLTHLRLTDHSLAVSPYTSSSNAINPSSSTSGTGAKSLADRTNAAFGMIDDAISRCAAFTRGFGILGLVDAADSFLASVITETPVDRKDSRRLSGQTGSAAGSKLGPSDSGPGAGSGNDEIDFEGLDYSTDDWAAFQYSLSVLGSCRIIVDKFSICEEGLLHALSQVDLDTPTLIRSSLLNSASLHAALTSLSSTTDASALSKTIQLKKARSALVSLTRSAHISIQSTILAPLETLLSSYPTLPIWSQPEKTTRRGELSVPTFSLSPTDTIARVAEGLLNLLRVFEVYAADQALAFSLATLPHVEETDLAAASAALSEEQRSAIASNTVDLGDDSGNPISTSITSSIGTFPTTSRSASINPPPDLVLSTWVSSLSLSLLSHMTTHILPAIRQLSGPGAEQLACDLGYLSNAVRALDVEWEGLDTWREAVEVSDEADWRKGKEDAQRGSGEGKAETVKIWTLVGRARGWTT